MERYEVPAERLPADVVEAIVRGDEIVVATGEASFELRAAAPKRGGMIDVEAIHRIHDDFPELMGGDIVADIRAMRDEERF